MVSETLNTLKRLGSISRPRAITGKGPKVPLSDSAPSVNNTAGVFPPDQVAHPARAARIFDEPRHYRFSRDGHWPNRLICPWAQWPLWVDCGPSPIPWQVANTPIAVR